jgi:outer membrane protein TolC
MMRIVNVLILSLVLGTMAPAFSQSIGLEEAIKAVCMHSDSARMMRETLKKSNEMVREKWANALPIVSVSAFGGTSYGSLASASSRGSSMSGGGGLRKSAATQALDSNDMRIIGRMLASTMGALMKPAQTDIYSTSLQITQPIYTFGKVGSALEVAQEFDKSVNSNYQRNSQQLQLLALDAYYRVVLSAMAMDIAQRSLGRKQELNDFLERNFKLGSGSRAQILATSADFKSQLVAINKAQQDLLSARMMLNILMGRNPEDSVTLDTSLTIAHLTAMPLPAKDDAVHMAVDRRGDLHSLEYLARATYGGARIYNAMYLPSIAGIGSIGTAGTKPKDIIDWDNRNWMVGLGLSWTLFDGFANTARAREYSSDAHKLEIAHDAVVKMIETEVAAALLECAGADSNLVAAREILAASAESYDLTNDNFKQGSGQFADLQLSEERLRQAEMGDVSARYRFLRSRAALLVVTGQDIVAMEEP